VEFKEGYKKCFPWHAQLFFPYDD